MYKICFLLVVWLTPVCFAADSGLLAWWRFDNDFRDSGPSSLHGRPLRGASFDVGRVGRALKLNGTSSFISVPDKPELRFGSGDFSVSLWILFPVTGKGEAFGLIGKDGDPKTGGWSLWADKVGLHYRETGGSDVGFSFDPFSSGWHHVVVVREKSGYRFYRDSQLAEQRETDRIAVLNADGPLIIGRQARANYAATLLDEVQLYNQSLDHDEVMALFNCIPPEVKAKAVLMEPPGAVKQPVASPVAAATPTQALTAPEPPVHTAEIPPDATLVTVSASPVENMSPVARLSPVTVTRVTTSAGKGGFASQPALSADGTITLVHADDGNIGLLQICAEGEKGILRAGGPGESGATAVVSTPQGRLGLTGFHAKGTVMGRAALLNAGESDIFVAALDAKGSLLWAVSAGGPGVDRGEDIAVDAAGNLYVTGSFSSGARFVGQQTTGGALNLFVACYGPLGRLLWLFEAGGPEGEISGGGIRVTASGSHIALSGNYRGKVKLGKSQLEGEGSFLAALRIEK